MASRLENPAASINSLDTKSRRISYHTLRATRRCQCQAPIVDQECRLRLTSSQDNHDPSLHARCAACVGAQLSCKKKPIDDPATTSRASASRPRGRWGGWGERAAHAHRPGPARHAATLHHHNPGQWHRTACAGPCATGAAAAERQGATGPESCVLAFFAEKKKKKTIEYLATS